MPIVSVKKLEDADIDCGTLEEVINGEPNKRIKTRLGREVWTLASVPLLSVYTIDETEALIDKEQNRAKSAEVELRNSKASKQELESGLSLKADKVYVDQLVIDAQNNIQNFKTEVELLAFTPDIENFTGKSLDTKKVWLWDGAQWNDTGLSEYDLANNERKKIIDDSQTASVDVTVESEDGFVLMKFENGGMDTSAFSISKETQKTGFSIESEDGFLLSGEVPTDTEISQIVLDTTALNLSPNLSCFADDEMTVHVPSLISSRVLQESQHSVFATISAKNTAYSKTNNQSLSLTPSKLGGEAIMYLRDENTYKQTKLDIAVKIVSKSGLVGSPKILMIGDSITNRGGASIVKKYLDQTGLTPQFIGTMIGSGENGNSTDTTGELNEGHEGWQTSDFTNDITQRTILASGQELTYMGYSKPTKNGYNAFVRPSTESDNPAYVKNGYILDFEWWRSRFSLSVPDVVFLQLGTNDISYQGDVALAKFNENYPIILDQLTAAFPSAKIVCSMNNIGLRTANETQWSRYVNLIRSMINIVKTLNNPNISICNSWLYQDIDNGYVNLTTTTDSISGAVSGELSDAIHPIYSGRQTLYKAVAAHIAAEYLNI